MGENLVVSKGSIEWTHQVLQEREILEHLERLQVVAQEFPVVLLKGGALIGDLYHPGERRISDLDLLVQNSDLLSIKERLLSLGYTPLTDGFKWYANSYKCLFSYPGVMAPVEIHTKLIWTEPENFKWLTCPSQSGAFLRLMPLHELLHLCFHYSLQHNFLHKFWLRDIHLHMSKYNEINWPHFWELCAELRVTNSIGLLFALDGNHCGQAGDMPENWRRAQWMARRMPLQFLDDPTRFPIWSLLTKMHSLQSLWSSARYAVTRCYGRLISAS